MYCAFYLFENIDKMQIDLKFFLEYRVWNQNEKPSGENFQKFEEQKEYSAIEAIFPYFIDVFFYQAHIVQTAKRLMSLAAFLTYIDSKVFMSAYGHKVYNDIIQNALQSS